MIKHRINSVEKARELIYDFHGRKIEIHDGQKWCKYSVRKVIPMYRYDGDDISDTEILLNKRRNYYFSIGLFLKGKSWVKNIKINGINLTARSMKAVYPVPENSADWIKTAKFIEMLRFRSMPHNRYYRG